jgi:hypothetical protein
MKTRGGEPGAASSLAPKLGPLGLVQFIMKNALMRIERQESRRRYPKRNRQVEEH